MSISVVIPTVNATPPALGAVSATPALNLASFLPADFANLLAQLATTSATTPSSAASPVTTGSAHAATPSLALETPSAPEQPASSTDSKPGGDVVTDSSEMQATGQAFLWVSQMPGFSLPAPVNTMSQGAPLCSTQPVGATVIPKAPPGRDTAMPDLLVTKAETNDPVPTVDAAPKTGGELKAQPNIPAVAFPVVAAHEPRTGIRADVETVTTSSPAAPGPSIAVPDRSADFPPAPRPTIQGVLEALSIDPQEVISAEVSAPPLQAPPDLTQQPAVARAELPVAARTDVGVKTVPTEPLTDLTDLAAEVEAAFPTEHARSSDRVAATTRPTTESPAAEIAPVPARSRAALGEGQDAGGADARSSSDADRASYGAQMTPQTHAVSKPSEASAFSPTIQDRMRVVEQVTQRLETLRLVQGRQEVTLHLRPEHLGDLRLTITTDGGDVTARIMADSSLVRQSVDEGRDQLRAALEQKGYTLQGLDVSVSQGRDGGSFSTYVPQNERPVYRPSSATVQQQPTEVVIQPIPSATSRLTRSGLDYQA